MYVYDYFQFNELTLGSDRVFFFLLVLESIKTTKTAKLKDKNNFYDKFP